MEEKLSEAELQERLDNATSAVQVGNKYRHYKGNLYETVMLAVIEATNEPAVIYRGLYGRKLTFIRPVGDWVMTVEWQGEVVPRFKLID